MSKLELLLCFFLSVFCSFALIKVMVEIANGNSCSKVCRDRIVLSCSKTHAVCQNDDLPDKMEVRPLPKKD